MRAPGLAFREQSDLVARAVASLERGARSTSGLARDVLGLREAPPGLAARLLREALDGVPRIREDSGGTWRLDEAGPDDEPAVLESLEYAVVDVETTGSSPGRGARVTEIAIVVVRDGDVVEDFSTLVHPGRPIPGWITNLTGIDDEVVADAPPFGDVADLVRRRLTDRIFVAHNAPFDWRFVAAEMERARSLLPVGPRLCTLRLARRALPGLRRRGLDALARYYDIEIEARHRARGDALGTAAVLLHLLEEADRRGVRTWADLRRWLNGEEPPA